MFILENIYQICQKKNLFFTFLVAAGRKGGRGRGGGSSRRGGYAGGGSGGAYGGGDCKFLEIKKNLQAVEKFEKNVMF